MPEMKCQTCATIIQPATADRTVGKCMPCAMQADPAFAAKVEAAKGSVSDKKPTLLQQVRALIVLLLVGSAFMAVIFIAKVVVSLIAVLIARYAFESSWDNAFFTGVITYLAIGFIELILDEWPKRSRRTLGKQPKE